MGRGRGGPRNARGGGGYRGRGGQRGGGNRGGRNKSGGWSQSRNWNEQDRVGPSQIDRSHEKFESYYNELDLIEEGDERKKFWDFMKSDLPNSFRFAGSRGHALTVQKRLINHYIPEIEAVEFEGQPVDVALDARRLYPCSHAEHQSKPPRGPADVS